MAKPAVAQTDWVESTPAARIEPSGSRKNTGYNPGEPLPAQNINWILYSIDQWIKYLEQITDAVVSSRVTLGTSAQVTAGLADFDDPQSAYDEVCDNGGGILYVLRGTIVGDLDMNQSVGVMVVGQGDDTIFSGNVTISANKHVVRDMRFGGNLSITGSKNIIEGFMAAAGTFSNGALTDSNMYRIQKDALGVLVCPSSVCGGPTVLVDAAGSLNSTHHGAFVKLDSSGGAFSLAMPSPSKDGIVTFKDILGTLSSNPVTLTRGAGVEVDGIDADFVLNSDFGSWTFKCDGSHWYRI